MRKEKEEMTVDPDAQLAAAGDMEAFEKIYRRYHRSVYSACLRMIRNVSQAEDLAQEVFNQLFRKICKTICRGAAFRSRLFAFLSVTTGESCRRFLSKTILRQLTKQRDQYPNKDCLTICERSQRHLPLPPVKTFSERCSEAH